MRESLGRAALLLGSAWTLALAFPITDWGLAAWIALMPLLVVVLGTTPRLAFAWGWLYGTVFFLILLRWLTWTFRVFSAIPWPLTWGPTLLLAAYCGLYVGLVSLLVVWLARRRSMAWALATAPCLWVGGEWIRGHLMGGFPWGTLGYSQYLRLPVIQVAELGGVHAVSLVLVAVNAALAGVFVLGWRQALGGVVIVTGVVALVLGFGTWRLRQDPPSAEMRVAVMQPSIEQPLKFEPRHARETLSIYLALTRLAGAGQPDVIVWPETASPTALRRDVGLRQTLAALSGELRAPLLVGSIDVLDGEPRAAQQRRVPRQRAGDRRQV